MDIEELKRLNNLTVALRKHGMADKSDDAYKQAELLLTNKKEEILPPFQPVVSHTVHDPLLEQKFTLALEMNNKKFQEAIDIISTRIACLAQEITGIKKEVTDLKSVPAQKTTPLQVEAETPKKEQTKESHPRQGQFAPEDVSIEKMFYYGKK